MAHQARPRGGRWAGKPFTVLGLLGSCLAVVLGTLGVLGVFRDAPSEARAAAAGAFSQVTTAPAVAPSSSSTPGTSQSPGARSVTPVATPVAAVVPVALQIPSIKVDTRMELLGLAADGTLQTPADARKAGWFTGSALPGAPGPVVIAGHVDSTTGPAVFVHLKSIKTGDPITITLSGGSRVEYRATSIVTYAKDKFPTESVYGPRPDSELRLITCGGAFVNGQYVDNVVVFAKLSARAPG